MFRNLLILFALTIVVSCGREESVVSPVETTESEAVTTTAFPRIEATELPAIETAVVKPAEATSPAVEPAANGVRARNDYEIINIRGDLYRARNSGGYTVFLVTPEGIILADPMSLEFSEWLKVEFANRFDAVVRYVLYSHHHWDRVSGGAVFEDTAEFIAHENLAAVLKAPLSGNQMSDHVEGPVIRSVTGGATRKYFDLLDANEDGELTAEEVNADIRVPDITYADTYKVQLGGKEVQLIYSGRNHTNDGSIMFFPEERVGFASDYINIKRLPGMLNANSLDDWIDSIDRMINLDIDMVSAGRGEIGSRTDLVAYRQYFQDLKSAVGSAIAEGASLRETKRSIQLDAYKDWERYDADLSKNIENAYALLNNGVDPR